MKKLLIEIPDEIYNHIKEHYIVSGIQNQDYAGLSCEVQAAIRDGKVLSEQTVIFTKDDVLSILKDLRISMDATATDLQNKIDKVESL